MSALQTKQPAVGRKARPEPTPEQRSARRAVRRINKAALAIERLGDKDRIAKAAKIINDTMLRMGVGATAHMKASKLTQDAPRSSLARLVRRRCDRREVTVWLLHTTHRKAAGGYAADTAQWVREKAPTAAMLEKEIQHHPHGSTFWLRRERRTHWSEWEATPNDGIQVRREFASDEGGAS